VLEGYPDEIVPEAVVLEHAARGFAEDESGEAKQAGEFLVAFKIDARHFRIIHRVENSQENEDFSATA